MGVASLEGQTNFSPKLKSQKLLKLVNRPSTTHQIMPYKNQTGTPASKQQTNGSAMATTELGKPIPALGGDVVMDDAFGTDGAVEEAGKKGFFKGKFGGIQKQKPVSAAIRKKRMNFRLRKVLTPKSPLMVLNEIVGGVNYTFVDTPTSMLTPGIPHLFTAQCVIEGETFSGTGPSKQIAKNICAEHVVQYVVTKKCTESKVKVEEADPTAKPPMEDDTPWLQLASLALFKLFNDWQAQGFVIPNELMKSPNENTTGNGNGASAGSMDVNMANAPPATKQKPKEAKKMPDNPTERHPVQLLNELRGGVTFTVVGSSGVTPNIIFTLGCEIDGTQYTGVGRNKKDAKKHCAMEALKVLYNVQYPGTLTAEAEAAAALAANA